MKNKLLMIVFIIVLCLAVVYFGFHFGFLKENTSSLKDQSALAVKPGEKTNPPPQNTACFSNTFVSQIGSQGTGNGQFNQPSDVTIDSAGNIYVSDTGNNKVQKFNSSGVYVAQSFGTNTHVPWGIAVDSVNDFYLVDQQAKRVKRYHWAGAFVPPQWANFTVDTFSMPTDISLISDGVAYIADTGHHKIKKIGPGAAISSGWGGMGTGALQFSSPTGVTKDASGNVYVADTANNRVQKLDSNGNFILMFGWGVSNGASQLQVCTNNCQVGIAGTGDGQFSQPRGVAVDNNGNLYVVDGANNRVQRFTTSGAFVSKWGSSGLGEGQFNQPRGITVDSSGNVYVADTGNHRIQKFSSGCALPPNTNLSCTPGVTKIGDVNGDNLINSVDALITGKVASGSIQAPVNKCCIDVNADGAINSNDALMIMKYFVRITTGIGNTGQICPN